MSELGVRSACIEGDWLVELKFPLTTWWLEGGPEAQTNLNEHPFYVPPHVGEVLIYLGLGSFRGVLKDFDSCIHFGSRLRRTKDKSGWTVMVGVHHNIISLEGDSGAYLVLTRQEVRDQFTQDA